MIDDLIKRLREIEYRKAAPMAITTALAEAADEIERLRADGSAMRASITRLVEEVELLRRAIAWMENEEPELVWGAQHKFGFKLYDDAGLPTAANVRGILKE